MVDELALRDIFSATTFSAGTFLVVFLMAVKAWNGLPALGQTVAIWRESRTAEQESMWNRMLGEIHRLSDAEKQCRADYDSLRRKFMDSEEVYNLEIADLRKEIADLKGYMHGQGRAANEAAGIVAAERLKGKDNEA